MFCRPEDLDSGATIIISFNGHSHHKLHVVPLLWGFKNLVATASNRYNMTFPGNSTRKVCGLDFLEQIWSYYRDVAPCYKLLQIWRLKIASSSVKIGAISLFQSRGMSGHFLRAHTMRTGFFSIFSLEVHAQSAAEGDLPARNLFFSFKGFPVRGGLPCLGVDGFGSVLRDLCTGFFKHLANWDCFSWRLLLSTWVLQLPANCLNRVVVIWGSGCLTHWAWLVLLCLLFGDPTLPPLRGVNIVSTRGIFWPRCRNRYACQRYCCQRLDCRCVCHLWFFFPLDRVVTKKDAGFRAAARVEGWATNWNLKLEPCQLSALDFLCLVAACFGAVLSLGGYCMGIMWLLVFLLVTCWANPSLRQRDWRRVQLVARGGRERCAVGIPWHVIPVNGLIVSARKKTFLI